MNYTGITYKKKEIKIFRIKVNGWIVNQFITVFAENKKDAKQIVRKYNLNWQINSIKEIKLNKKYLLLMDLKQHLKIK